MLTFYLDLSVASLYFMQRQTDKRAYFIIFAESWIERCLNESENKRYSSHTSLGNVSNDESK